MSDAPPLMNVHCYFFIFQ